MAEHWAERGIKVHVLCAWKPGLLEYEVLRSVKVFRVGHSIFEKLRFHIKKSEHIQDMKHTGREPLRLRAQAGTFIKKIQHFTWKKLYWPDSACLWYFPALKKAYELIHLHSYDALITVSHPFTSHLVGLSLNKQFQSVTWLVDIGDSFSYAREMPLNNLALYSSLNVKTEGKIFKNATQVVVTNHNARARYIETFGISPGPHISVIGPLVSFPLSSSSQSSVLKITRQSQINLVFTGNLINPVRKPALFFTWLRDLIHLWHKTYSDHPLVCHLFGDYHLSVRLINKKNFNFYLIDKSLLLY